MATDPFHDAAVKPIAMPDGCPMKTVMVRKMKSYNLIAPLATTSPWCAHVFTLPILSNAPFTVGAETTGTYQVITDTPVTVNVLVPRIVSPSTAVPQVVNLGTLNIHAWATDGALGFPHLADPYVIPDTAHSISTDDTEALSSTRGRLVGMGYEIINTTAVINLQGLITQYRAPSTVPEYRFQPNDSTSFLRGGAGPYVAQRESVPAVMTQVVDGPPSNVSDALTYYGTQQWEAKEGVYAAMVFEAPENKLDHPDVQAYLIRNEIQGAPPLADNTTGLTPENATCFFTPVTTSNTTNHISVPLPLILQQFVPVAITGTYLTGLSPLTTLTVNVLYFYEVAPHPRDIGFNQLVYLANFPPPRDDFALLEYQRVSRLLPSGVPRCQNGAGEYWEGVKALLREAVPYAGNIASLFGVGTAGQAAASAVANGLSLAYPTRPAMFQPPDGRSTLLYSPARVQGRTPRMPVMQRARARSSSVQSRTRSAQRTVRVVLQPQAQKKKKRRARSLQRK